MAAQDIIIRPIITEKTMDGTSQKKYTFEVDRTPPRSTSSGLWKSSSA